MTRGSDQKTPPWAAAGRRSSPDIRHLVTAEPMLALLSRKIFRNASGFQSEIGAVAAHVFSHA